MNSSPSEKTDAPDPANDSAEPVGSEGLEKAVRGFWEKNRSFILGLCAVVLLFIVGREGWRLVSEARDRSVQQDYSQAGDDLAKLARFAADHSGHPLAGAALLRIADQKFESRDFKAAADAYEKAAGALDLDLLKGRARLGAAISRADSGDAAGGESALKAIQSDTTLPKALRAEAAYHLASLVAADGRKDEAVKLADEVTTLDPTGPWSQRAASLRASLEIGKAPATAADESKKESSPTVTFKPSGS